MLDVSFFSGAAKCTIENTWRCLIGQCTRESTWRCFDWAMHNRRHVALFTLVIKRKLHSPKSREHCDALFALLKIDIALTKSISSWGAQNTYKERHTLLAVDPHYMTSSVSFETGRSAI